MLTEEDKEFYYQNIRTFIMTEHGYDYNDMDYEEVEDLVNRESDRLFEAIFEEEY